MDVPGAKETDPVQPVTEKHVHAVLSFVSPRIAAMIQLQLLTGMRSSEMTSIRPCDIETNRWRVLTVSACHT